MRRARIKHSVRTLGVAALVLGVPLPLIACAQSEATGSVLGSELRAATGSDVFSEPAVQEYTVDSITLTRPDPASLTALGMANVDSTGSLQVSDGVITDAHLTVSTGIADQAVSFTLTEPLVLRREDNTGEPVDATGVLDVGSVQHHNAHVTMTPFFSEEGTATLEIEFDVPDDMFSPGQRDALPPPGLDETIAATVTLTAS